ncbi:acetyltransferase [Flavobacterium sp. IMCC34852]|uniref:Acetyltransferase n=1 Tax=Flavobacterium rivulicola TaxID=2732161 RepID=A0A7Y3R9W1_9FLAO|nr:acetyltransferase [Flavobacterium sp. IMCC34852]NNT72567.1 acetyltransferase [Flavobacterium sp. IMCC34852]
METNITLYGASGHSKVIIDILNCNSATIASVIDDHPKTDTILGLPVIKNTDVDFSKVDQMIISIGNNKVRERISTQVKVNYVNAIHPSAIISNAVTLGKGNVIMAGAIINPDAIIGNHCIINTGAVVEHDCHIANFVHVSPSVSLAGNVTVGQGTHIGIGAKVIQGITIGKWVTIGAGAVIIKDVPDYAVVVGNPGKIIKFNKDNE